MTTMRSSPTMVIAGRLAEYIPIDPDSVLDTMELSITRTPRPAHRPMLEQEGRWAGRLRRIGAAKLRHWRQPTLVDDFQLLISELVTNALRYGEGEITIRLVLATKALVIEVTDGSADFPRMRRPSLDDENGRGLLIVAAVATDWGYSPDGTSTWCTIPTVPVEGRR